MILRLISGEVHISSHPIQNFLHPKKPEQPFLTSNSRYDDKLGYSVSVRRRQTG